MGTLVLFAGWVSPAVTAEMYLNPSNSTIITGCTSYVTVRIHTQGNQTNGAQLYLSHNGLPGEVVLQSAGGAFDVYRMPDINPTPYLALRGYGGYLSGNAVQFARVQLLSTRIGATIALQIYADGTDDYTTRIARDGIDITTGVSGGTYTVVDGFCDTVAPQVVNLTPVPNEPNHPVDQPIAFHLVDNSSGVAIETFQMTLEHDGFPGGGVTYTHTSPEVTYTAINSRDYAVVVTPATSFLPHTLVRSSVRVNDRAGNTGSRNWSFNGLTCEELGCATVGQTVIVTTTVPSDPIIEYVTTTIPGGTEIIYVTTTIPGEPGGTTPDPESVFGAEDLLYFLGNRAIQVYAAPGNVVTALAANPLGIDLVLRSTEHPMSSITLHTPFAAPLSMVYDNTTGRYRADMTLPSTAGVSDAFVRVQYSNGTIESVPFRIHILPYGEVLGITTDGTVPLAGAVMTLEAFADGEYTVVAERITTESGRYAFLVPNGIYRLRTSVDGYRSETTARFRVDNHIVNRSVTLRPPIQLLDPDVPLEEKITYAVATVREQVDTVRDILNDPIVEQRSQDTVAPVAAAVTVAALAPALSSLGLLNYVRFFFLQPLLLFGRRKRKGWGYVYNTLTRTPVDLAQVRLIDTKTNRIVQSRVTDTEGRYMFFADPGVYRIEVDKQQFTFPTTLLVGEQEDGPYLDIYHGEPIRVTEDNTAIVANIPLDPITAEKKPARIAREKMWRKLQSILSGVGVLAGGVAVVISPTPFTIGLFLLQIIILIIFYRLAKPVKPHSWGIVYDMQDNKKLSKVVVRLFSKRFDKLVSTDYTDTKGRYAFLVNPNEYYVMYQKPGYASARKDVVITKDADIVSETVGLEKESDQGAGSA